MAYQNLRDPANSMKLLAASANAIQPTRGLYIASDGLISIETLEGDVESNVPVFAGTQLSVRIVKLTAATATVYALR